MSVKFRIVFLLGLSGLFAVLFFSYSVLGQELDKERAISIVQTQGGPGGCTDEASCSSFCENPDNYGACVSWARDNGLISSEEAEKVEKLAKVGREFSGPGGCSSHQECQAFCEQPQNHNTCIDFAVSQGFMTQEEADRIKEFRREAERFREEAERGRERFEQEFEVDPEFDKDRALAIIESQGGPGGCGSFEECEAFCEQPQNQETCFEFAEEHGLFKNSGHAEKIKKVLKEGGPGGCRGELQCRQFCENPDNFEACIEFAEKNEFIPREEVEKAKKGIRALKEGGPGGCHGPKECEEVCRKPENQEACFEWAKRHGLMSEEELRKIEEFKRRGEELRNKFEQRSRPPEGFEPPGEFLGPGGCVGAEECRKYCEDPAHKEVCQFFRTPSGGQPPGFGGTPPPEAEHIRACFEKGGNWTGSTCEFPGIKGEICPKLPTVDSCPSGYRKDVVYSSPECGTYYQCVPEEGGYTPPPEHTPVYSPIYSPTPEVYEDPATRCAKQGGTWNVDTKTCIFEKGASILQNTGAYIGNAFRDFFR